MLNAWCLSRDYDICHLRATTVNSCAAPCAVSAINHRNATGLGSAVVEHPPMVWQVPGSITGVGSYQRLKKMEVMASLHGAEELKVSITTDSSVSV